MVEFSVHDFEGTRGCSDRLGYIQFPNGARIAYKVVRETEAEKTIQAGQIKIPEEFSDTIFIPQVYAVVELHEASWLAEKVESSRLSYNSGSIVLFQSFCAGSTLYEIVDYDFKSAETMTVEKVDSLINFFEHLNENGIKHGSVHIGNIVYNHTQPPFVMPSSEALALLGVPELVVQPQPLNSFAVIDWEGLEQSQSQQSVEDNLQQLYEFRESLESQREFENRTANWKIDTQR